jgi:hypothetical protein
MFGMIYYFIEISLCIFDESNPEGLSMPFLGVFFVDTHRFKSTTDIYEINQEFEIKYIAHYKINYSL